MNELVGYSRAYVESTGVELVSDEIRSKTLDKVRSIFGNARHDIAMLVDKRNSDDKQYESFLQFEVVITELTSKMVSDLINTSLFIKEIHSTSSIMHGKRIRLYVRIATIFADEKKYNPNYKEDKIEA